MEIWILVGCAILAAISIAWYSYWGTYRTIKRILRRRWLDKPYTPKEWAETKQKLRDWVIPEGVQVEHDPTPEPSNITPIGNDIDLTSSNTDTTPRIQ